MLVQEILIPRTRALAVNPLVVRPVGRSEEGGEEAHGDQVDRAVFVHGTRYAGDSDVDRKKLGYPVPVGSYMRASRLATNVELALSSLSWSGAQERADLWRVCWCVIGWW